MKNILLAIIMILPIFGFAQPTQSQGGIAPPANTVPLFVKLRHKYPVMDSFYLSGTDLVIRFRGDSTRYIEDLSSLSTGAATDVQTLTDEGKAGNLQSVSIENGNQITFSVADQDTSITNEIELPTDCGVDQINKWDGFEWVCTDDLVAAGPNDRFVDDINRSGENIVISRTSGLGNLTVSVADMDNDPSGEIQALSISNRQLTLSKGGLSVGIPETSPQTLSVDGSALTISGGNTIALPSGGGSSLWEGSSIINPITSSAHVVIEGELRSNGKIVVDMDDGGNDRKVLMVGNGGNFYDHVSWNDLDDQPVIADITGVTANVGISGGGTSGDVSIALALEELSIGTVVSGDHVPFYDISGGFNRKTTFENFKTALNIPTISDPAWGDITGIPAGFVDGTDDVDDDDSSITNEVQDLSLSSHILSLSQDATTVDLSIYNYTAGADIDIVGNVISLEPIISPTTVTSSTISSTLYTGGTMTLTGTIQANSNIISLTKISSPIFRLTPVGSLGTCSSSEEGEFKYLSTTNKVYVCTDVTASFAWTPLDYADPD